VMDSAATKWVNLVLPSANSIGNGISIGLVPAFEQTLRALCHELHVAYTYWVSSVLWVLSNLWVNVRQKSTHHPRGRATAKCLMRIEHVCCMTRCCQWTRKAYKGGMINNKRHVMTCNLCNAM
jgi:hypothetical protein